MAIFPACELPECSRINLVRRLLRIVATCNARKSKKGRLSIAGFLLLAAAQSLHGQTTSFRYFYDDAGELSGVLDSTGTLIQYTYDPSGNITQVTRSTVPPSQLSILNVTPSHTIGGSTLTILGQNFSAMAAGDIVMIGGVAATVISASATQLVVTVPTGTLGGQVSVTVGGSTATWGSSISVLQPPLISGLSPSSGVASTSVTVSVTGQYLTGATFTLQSIDPADTGTGGTVSVVSNSGTTAALTFALGSTQGGFALVGTNSSGVGAVTPASLFLIGPALNTANFSISVLNSGYNPSTGPLLPAGQKQRKLLLVGPQLRL